MHSNNQFNIPFNKPFLTGEELENIAHAHKLGCLAGDGHFTSLCSTWLEDNLGASKALLTHSCTAALEIAAILLDIAEGDEVIMPSYTFVSTANAITLRGGTPVFVDIRPDTLNIDDTLIEEAITDKTKAIVVVHYAGVACEMDAIMDLAKKYNLFVVEDAAQAILSSYKGQMLGSIGHLGCVSFHETKNIISGEGGALLINDPRFIERAEIIREKGTNRSRFFRGQVDKYSWVDIGSSYLPGEIIAAFLWAQLTSSDVITQQRIKLWNGYQSAFRGLEEDGLALVPQINPNRCANGHIFYLLLRDEKVRSLFINKMRAKGIYCVFHYLPLHSSDMGKKLGLSVGSLKVTEQVADSLVRLPLWIGLGEYQDIVIESAVQNLKSALSEIGQEN